MRLRHWIKWFILILVRPVLVMWLMIEGAPEVVREIFKGIATVAKALK